MNQMIEHGADPGVVALAELRMCIPEQELSMRGQVLQHLRIITTEYNRRLGYWPPIVAWFSIAFAALCGACAVVVIQIIGAAGHP